MAHGTRHKRKRLWRSYVSRPQNSQAPQVTTVTKIIRYVSVSVQTDDKLASSNRRSFGIQELESVNRITNLPIVESGWNYAENIYNRIKKSNSLVYWTLGQAETTVQTVVDTAAPAMILFQGPLSSVDKLVCRSLDVVENRFPSIGLPPEMIYWNTKQYAKDVSTKIVRPVLKRADSVKQIGNNVLASKYTAFAADTLNGALDVADKYVDKYLPADDEHNLEEVGKTVDGPAGKALSTINHADRFGRKLKRRITKMTIAEVKALKEQSAEAVHVLVYVAELIATDPKLAFQKGKELWASLSQDEPENQARPENLEQLVVLLTRESARRVVHLLNFTSGLVSKIPRRLSHSVLSVVNKFLYVADTTIKTVHMEEVQKSVVKTLRIQAHHGTILLKHLNIQLAEVLEQLAQSLAVQEQPKSALSVPQIKVKEIKAAAHRNSAKQYNSKPINGTENNSPENIYAK